MKPSAQHPGTSPALAVGTKARPAAADTEPYIETMARQAGRLIPLPLQRILDSVTLGGILGLLLSWYRPSLLLLKTTTSGGDMGAHVYPPWYLKTQLLPKLMLFGWSPDWFAGFPLFHFYFPLVATFQAVLSYLIPYEIAFKLGTVVGPLFLPIAVYLLFRLLRFTFPTPAIAAVLSLGFQRMESYSIYGGNIPSSLAGEYAYALSLGLSLVFLGLAYRVATEERARPILAAVVLALAALSHLIPVMVVAMFVPVLAVLAVRTHGVAGGLRRLALVFGLGFAFAAFWAVPLLARIQWTANMRWGPLQDAAKDLFPAELRLYQIGAAGGALLALFALDRRVLVWVVPALYAMILYFALPQGHLWNGRFVPFWYLGAILTSAYFLGSLASYAAASVTGGLGPVRWAPAVIPLLALGLTFGAMAESILGSRDRSYIDDWIRWNYEGVERKPAYPELRSLLDRLRALPPGRVFWEPSPDLNEFGTPVELMAIPYFTGHPSLEGMYFESSITTPFHFLTAAEVADRPSNPIPGLPYSTFHLKRGVRHMALFDVRYFVAWSEKAREAATASQSLRHLGDAGRFSVFELREHAQVVVPEFEPVVLEGADWEDTHLAWFSDLESLDVPLVRRGLPEWTRVSGVEGLPRKPIQGGGRSIEAEMDGFEIRFHTDAVGKPHWIRTSYFPNWKVEGAIGPFLASPSLMLVVPTQEDVRLYYARTWAEWFGLAITACVLLAVAFPRSRRWLRNVGGA